MTVLATGNLAGTGGHHPHQQPDLDVNRDGLCRGRLERNDRAVAWEPGLALARQNGTQTFSLPNSWAYGTGTYTTTLNYTLTVP